MSPASAAQTASAEEVTLRSVTVLAGVVVALTFIFGFGNVWNLALRLGVPLWVAPLVAPAVDLSILALLLGTRHLALHGASAAELKPARRLLIFASLATLALNIADPIVAVEYGKAAFDAVGPLLLIGWAEVGPSFLQAISTTCPQAQTFDTVVEVQARMPIPGSDDQGANPRQTETSEPAANQSTRTSREGRSAGIPNDLVDRARREDAEHRAVHQRPISADTLRTRLGIGAKRARRLVALVRSEAQMHATVELAENEIESDGTAGALAA